MSSQNVKVTSIAALAEFRNALCTFAEDARSSIGNAEMDVRRTNDWLARGQTLFWQAEIKKSELAVAEAQAALFRRKISQTGDTANDSEQRENLRNAKRRLQHAEDKLRVVKRWIPQFQHAVGEFHARVHPIGDMASGELDRALRLLDNMVAALDAYTRIAPPPSSRDATASGTTAGSPAGAAAGTTESAAIAPPSPEPDSASPQPAEATSLAPAAEVHPEAEPVEARS